VLFVYQSSICCSRSQVLCVLLLAPQFSHEVFGPKRNNAIETILFMLTSDCTQRTKVTF